MNETDSLNVKSGPPFRPTNGSPSSVNSTVRTSPCDVLGLSAGARLTLSMWLFGSSDVYSVAASSASPLNHRHVAILDMGYLPSALAFVLRLSIRGLAVTTT